MKKIMRAGSPISMKGKLANDNTAMGILLDDVTREYPMGEIVILGFVDYEIAQNASGITLTPEAKAAMKNITFVGDPESGSSGGGKVVQADWNQYDAAAPDYIKNRPMYQDIIEWESEHIQVLKGEKKSVKVENVPIIMGEKFWFYASEGDGGSVTLKPAYIGVTRSLGSSDGLKFYCLIEEAEEPGKYNVTFTYDNQSKYNEATDAYIAYKHESFKPLDAQFLPDDGVTTIVKENFPGGVGYEETATVNEPLNITWDGNTEGLVSVPMKFGGAYYKVSESVFTNEQIKQMYYHVTYNPDGIYKLIDSWDSAVESGRVTDNIVAPDNDSFIVFVRNAGATLFEGQPWEVTFLECGVYFKKETEDFGGNYILDLRTDESIEYAKTVQHKIDEKFLPESGSKTLKIYYDGSNYRANMSYEELLGHINNHTLEGGWYETATGDFMPMLRCSDYSNQTPKTIWVLFEGRSTSEEFFYFSDGTITKESPYVPM